MVGPRDPLWTEPGSQFAQSLVTGCQIFRVRVRDEEVRKRPTSLLGHGPGRQRATVRKCRCVFDLYPIGIRDSVFAAALVGNRLQRPACQILIIATYGALVARAREYISRGHMSRTHLIASPRELIVLAVASVADTRTGMAVMPVLDAVSPRLVARMSRSRFKAAESFNSDVIRMRATREQR